MGLWDTIKGWFSTAADATGLTDAVDDATGGAVSAASDAMDTAGAVEVSILHGEESDQLRTVHR